MSLNRLWIDRIVSFVIMCGLAAWSHSSGYDKGFNRAVVEAKEKQERLVCSTETNELILTRGDLLACQERVDRMLVKRHEKTCE